MMILLNMLAANYNPNVMLLDQNTKVLPPRKGQKEVVKGTMAGIPMVVVAGTPLTGIPSAHQRSQNGDGQFMNSCDKLCAR